MARRESYDPGIPAWIDLMSPDVDGAKAFYTALFGWEAEDQFDDQGNRIYVSFRKDGRNVAGLSPQQPEMEGMPAVWNHYIATADCDATVKQVEAAGGFVMMPTMDVMDEGRMAIVADPAGAMFSLWEAGRHVGAQTVNEHGAFGWSELLTRARDEVRPFYEQVFGWQLVDQDMGPTGTYTVATFDGQRSFAGMMDMPEAISDQVPNYWTIYLGHDDVDAACEQVRELGGEVHMAPFDIPGVGRMATVADPQGGVFNLMAALEWQD